MSARPRVLDAVAELRDQIARLRSEASDLRGELEIEGSRPVPVDEVDARIEATVARLQGFVADRVSVGDLILPDGHQSADYLARLQVPGFAIAAVVAPDQLSAWLRGQSLTAMQKLPEPASAEDLAKRIATLKAKLKAAEVREIDLLWQATEAGIGVDWREDLDPALVLGLEDAR
jgi:hypothetical protein